MGKEFVQHVKVTGVEDAIGKLRALGFQVEALGDDAVESGRKSEQGAQATGQLGESAKRAIAGYLGFNQVLKLFEQLKQSLEEIVNLQSQLAGGAVTLADSSKELARQLGVSEEEGVSILTQLRIAGGAEAQAAKDFGIRSDLALKKAGMGGLLSGENFAVAREVFAFTGAKAFEGEAAAELIDLLGITGNLVSPDKTRDAIARINAAAIEADVENVGAFVFQSLKGAKNFIQQGVPLDDVLIAAGRARSAEVSEERAAETLKVLDDLVFSGAEPKFNRILQRRLGVSRREFAATPLAEKLEATLGLFAEADTPEEVEKLRRSVSAERFGRLFKSFGPANVRLTEGVERAISGATPLDVDLAVEQGRQEITFRSRQNKAAQEFESFRTGVETFTIAQARARAKTLLDEQIAKGVVVVPPGAREAEEERIVMGLLLSRIEKIESEGGDASRAREVIDGIGRFGFNRATGYSDQTLFNIARETDEAARKLSLDRQAELTEAINRLRETMEQQRALAPTVQNVTNNTTNMGTVYVEPDPVIEPQQPLDRSD